MSHQDDQLKLADEPRSLDYVTSAKLRGPDLQYRDPVDEMVFLARCTSICPSGRMDLVYYRGNTLVTVYDVKVQVGGIGCCWEIEP